MNLVLVFFLFIGQQINKNTYQYEIKIDKDVVQKSNIQAILPNSDNISIPVYNNLIPVIYIFDVNDKSKKLLLDYNDPDCHIFVNQKSIIFSSKKNAIKPTICQSKDDILETFSSIKKQIQELKDINKNVDYTQTLNRLSESIEECKNMIKKTDKSVDDLKKSQEKFQSKEEIIKMLSEMKTELTSLQEKINLKYQKKTDIIDPNLPIIDKELIPSGK